MQIFWFYFWIILCYAVIAAAFIILMAISNAEERRERARERCMMNHPAGSRARTEPSPTGQTKQISAHIDQEWFDARREGVERIKSGELWLGAHSSEGFSSRPHHLEGD